MVEADKYAEVTITIDDVELLSPETILILDEFIEEEVEVDGKKIRMPEAIIGSGTMDKYGVLLDPRGGVIVRGAGLLL